MTFSIPPLIVIAYPRIQTGEQWARAHADCAERQPVIYNYESMREALMGKRGHTVVFVNCEPTPELRAMCEGRNHFIKVNF